MIRGAISGDFHQIGDRLRGGLSGELRQAVDAVSAQVQAELRQQVIGAGLGGRLAAAYRRRVYPESGRETLSPAALVWSKAEAIIRAYNEGATIIAHGRQFLAIPQPIVPRTGRGRRMTVRQVEQKFGARLRFVPTRRGAVLVLDVALSRGGIARRSTATRERRGQVRSQIMFVLVRQVSVKKRLDIAGAGAAGQAALGARVASIRLPAV